jgi:predicted nuclease of predicted toxin-antitoxin system
VKLIIDMNLSPNWVPLFQAAGHQAQHWSAIGNANASDLGILTQFERELTNGALVSVDTTRARVKVLPIR